MGADVELLLQLLDQDGPAYVTQEDFDGPHAAFLRACQLAGFLATEPESHPVPGCPHCGVGVAYRLADRWRCNACRDVVDPRHLLAWRLDREGFLVWLAAGLKVRGAVRRIEERLWHLGAWVDGKEVYECFYRRAGPLSAAGETRVSAYRHAIQLHGLHRPSGAEGSGRCVSLLSVLRADQNLTALPLGSLLRVKGTVRFDAHSGAVWVGDALLGEIPVGSKEYLMSDS